MFGLLWTAGNCCVGKYEESQDSWVKGAAFLSDIITGLAMLVLGALLVAGICPLLSMGIGYAVSAGVGGAMLIGSGGLNLCLSIPITCCCDEVIDDARDLYG